MRVRLLVTVSVLVLVAVGCSGAQTTPGEAGRDGALATDRVLLGTLDGPLVVDLPAGDVVFDGAGSVSSLGGRWAVSAAAAKGSTALEFVDGSTGGVISTASVPGDLEPRIVSESGRAVALTEPMPAGWDPAVPLPRASTTIVVADPTGGREPITLELSGNFEPEAFSSDDRRLFLLQHLPAETPTDYRVTVLDLRREKLLPVLGPFKGPSERMPGTRLTQLLAPDAAQLYTLYTSSKPGYAPHQAPVPEQAAVSFVHVLSLTQGWAHCVGLPESMWDRPAAEQAMATTPDGSYLFVIDAGRGVVAAMHTQSLKVRETEVALPFGEEIASTSAQMSPDARTLYVAAALDGSAPGGGDRSIVAALDAGTFELLDTWELQGNVSGLGVSSDGEGVYAAVGGRVAVLDAASGAELGEVSLPTDEPVVRVIPLAA